MDDIEYNEKTKSFDSDPDLQEKIRFLADVMETNHIIHEGTVTHIYHLLKFYPMYLKLKLVELLSDIEDPDNLVVLANYDPRDGNFYYLFDIRYLELRQAIEIVKLYIDKKYINESF